MYIETISDHTPKARKHHRCKHCAGWIVPGEVHRRAVYKYDSVYTWRTHLECEELYELWLKVSGFGFYEFDDGYPPLIDGWSDSDFEAECGYFRGRFPHAVTRMELTKQLSELRWRQ